MLPNTRSQDRWTSALAIFTIAAVLVSALALWGAGLFRLDGGYASLDDLDEVGGFLGGVFAPIVLAWAARSFFLQRQQLLDSMSAMATQAELMAEQAKQQNIANAHQAAQLATLERHREEDRRLEEERTAPRFSLRSVTNEWKEEKNGFAHTTEITNSGALALGYRLRVYSIVKVGDRPHLIYNEDDAIPFRLDESRVFDIVIPDGLMSEITEQGFVCEIESMRADQRVSFQKFTSNSLFNYFEPEAFEAVSAERKFRLAAFGTSKRS